MQQRLLSLATPPNLRKKDRDKDKGLQLRDRDKNKDKNKNKDRDRDKEKDKDKSPSPSRSPSPSSVFKKVSHSDSMTKKTQETDQLKAQKLAAMFGFGSLSKSAPLTPNTTTPTQFSSLPNVFGDKDKLICSCCSGGCTPHSVKVMLLGDSGVGKTSLLCRWASPRDGNVYMKKMLPTVGLDYRTKNVEVEGHRLKVQVWDTAGQERFRVITRAYYRGTHGMLLVFDVTNRATFDNVQGWIKNVHEHLASTTDFLQTNPENKSVRFVLVGNKIDLVEDNSSVSSPDSNATPTPRRTRQVSRAEAEALARRFGVPYFETSAMSLPATGVEESFDRVLQAVVREYFPSPVVSTAALPSALGTRSISEPPNPEPIDVESPASQPSSSKTKRSTIEEDAWKPNNCACS